MRGNPIIDRVTHVPKKGVRCTSTTAFKKI